MCEINVKNEKNFETNVRNQPIFRKKYTQNRGGGSFTGDRGRFSRKQKFGNQCAKPM